MQLVEAGVSLFLFGQLRPQRGLRAFGESRGTDCRCEESVCRVARLLCEKKRR